MNILIQTDDYKKQIMNETNYKISIEAAITEPWKKFIGENGICFGVDDFGKSAPGKDVFKSFRLDAENVIKQTRRMLNK